ncbi:CdaR family transcriptional regulator [Tsukamurella sp. 1534]|uniref:PucR family transcriptional regulator n=1 Tax=Tsukamurella sp. 1534 TaxID=1151061 RepID=UPI0002D56FDA|nr:helix-turn-helix domain-containing protein [Tsukamurella sp. 1534]
MFHSSAGDGAGVPRIPAMVADTVGVLRILAHFDALTETACDADALVREAERVAGCPVEAAPVASGEIGVKVRRDGGAHPLDVVLADRLARALRAARDRPRPSLLRLGDPGLVEIAVSRRESREDRLRAVALLGLDPGRPLAAVAVAAADDAAPGVEALRRAVPGRVAPSDSGRLVVCLVGDPPPMRELTTAVHGDLDRRFPNVTGVRNPLDVWLGIGEALPAHRAPESWRQACVAVRFASSTVFGRRAVPYGPLGSLAMLAEVPPDRLAEDPGLAALDGVLAAPGGDLDVEALESYCVFGSLRRTAAELRLHHSTVGARLARVEAATGWRLEDPVDRFQATLALLARRLRSSDAALRESDLYPG